MLRSCLWLSLIVVGALLIVGGYVGATRGSNSVLAAIVAAGLCWFGSTAALLIAGFSGRSNNLVYGHLLGMFCRLGLPLVAGLVIQKSSGRLAEAGVFGLIVVFYLITLVAETYLSLRFIKRSENVTRAT